MNKKIGLLNGIEKKLEEVTREMKTRDVEMIKKGNTPLGWDCNSPKLLAIKKVLEEIEAAKMGII